MNYLNRLGLAAAVCLIITSQANADAVISDQSFNNDDWSFAIFDQTGGASQDGLGQVISGGNPGDFRRNRFLLPGGSSPSLGLFHSYNAENYDPSVSGAISTLDFSEDRIVDVNVQGNALVARPALRQDGVIYFGPSLGTSFNSWTNYQLTALTASDFSNLAATANPDFGSSGGVVEFGYSHFLQHSGVFPEINRHGIDNWSYSISSSSVPEPSTIGLFGLCLGGLVLPRRRSKS